MNIYLLALIGLVVIMAVGFVFYGVLYKSGLSDVNMPHDPVHIGASLIAIYLTALLFTVLYNDIVFTYTATGVVKGLLAGLMVGLTGMGLPLLADGGWLKTGKTNLRAFGLNWLIAFLLLGVVVGLLAK